MAKEFVVGHGDLHTMQGNEKILARLIEGFNHAQANEFCGVSRVSQDLCVAHPCLGVNRRRRVGHLLSLVAGVVHFWPSFASATQNAALLRAAERDYISSGSRQSSSLHSMCSRSQIGRSLEEICSVL